VITVHVKLFAAARDIVGANETDLSLEDGSHASSVLEHFLKVSPKLSSWKDQLRLAVNFEYVDLHCQLHDGDEVAIIPPVSGG
jgi:molybdopterin synthase sulfur carrier subunit